MHVNGCFCISVQDFNYNKASFSANHAHFMYSEDIPLLGQPSRVIDWHNMHISLQSWQNDAIKVCDIAQMYLLRKNHLDSSVPTTHTHYTHITHTLLCLFR